MTREHVITAVQEGIPFQINMADGRSYVVADRFRVSVGKTTVIVMDDKDCPHVLPLLTVTGLSYLSNAGA